MSSEEIVISAQGLSKCYPIFSHPRDRLKQFIVPALQRMAGFRESRYFHEFWSLRDVSLEIRRGDTVGIIGRNGAGKSTLLQILCGTLDPTTGSYQTKGRVAALLELGSGFNPEFSGRDNVYLNATLLGLTREEVDARFDAIAAFADIGDFIEQPVKTYSSGMYVRLAFSVIAHVDADILIIDEALAVGDAVFTQKCMRFIRGFQEHGTLLFVSHDISSVQSLCKQAIWLHHGKVREVGNSKLVSENYLHYTLQETYGEHTTLKSTRSDELSQREGVAENSEDRINEPKNLYQNAAAYSMELRITSNLNEARGWKTGGGEIISVKIENRDGDGSAAYVFSGGERVRLELKAQIYREMERPILGFLVRDKLGQDLFGENTLVIGDAPALARAGDRIQAVFEFILPMLPNGSYAVMASLADGDLHDNIQHHYLHDAALIEVISSRVRWGLVGVSFSNVELRSCTGD